MQMEQLMFQVQFGGQVSNSSLPGQNFYLPQGPYCNPSHCNRQGLQFGTSLGSYHFQIVVNGKSQERPFSTKTGGDKIEQTRWNNIRMIYLYKMKFNALNHFRHQQTLQAIYISN